MVEKRLTNTETNTIIFVYVKSNDGTSNYMEVDRERDSAESFLYENIVKTTPEL